MSTLVFDIETVPVPFISLDGAQQEYILRGATTPEEREAKLDQMGLRPLTAQVVCIGLFNIETGKATALFLADAEVKDMEENEHGVDVFHSFTGERALLDEFWEGMHERHKYKRIVTFNGRNFDCPFMMMRSAILGVRPTRNLMAGTKWNYAPHVDLADELSFYGGYSSGATKLFSLDYYTRAFGIASPKTGSVNGHEVGKAFAEKRFREIAEYCLRDVRATAALYEKWRTYLSFKPE